MDNVFQKLLLRRERSLFRSRKDRKDPADHVPSASSNGEGHSIDHGPSNAQDDRLCGSCRRLTKTFTKTRPDTAHNVKHLEWLYSRKDPRRFGCQLCQFFIVFLKVKSIDTASYESRNGVAITLIYQSMHGLNPNYCDYDRSSDAAFLTSGGTRKLGIRKRVKMANDMEPRRIEHDKIDYGIVRRWLNFCEEHHEKPCQTATANIHGLKVIDCHTRRIVPAGENCKFVALSYVWGVTVAPERPDGLFPPTIEDSIAVTLQLGMQYLWVDKYCIDQSNADEKHSQIQNMDRIYSMAAMTIVAAAGKDSSYGLPGVSRSRHEQAYLSLPNVELIEIHSGLASLRESSWASRAWTLQEAYLSNRRLIFTDYEVSFLCNHMYCQESVNQKLHHRRNAHWDGLDGSHLFGVSPSWRYSRFDADQLLTEYTKRNLSFDSDALNACLGVLKATRPLHWLGMPIITSRYSERFTLDLQWMQGEPSFNTSRSEQLPSVPRSGFPSWSWTNIRGEKTFPQHRTAEADHCSISTLSLDGQWMTVDEWMRSNPGDKVNPSSRLRVTGFFAKPKFVTGDWLKDVARIHPHELRTGGSQAWALWSLEDTQEQDILNGSNTRTWPPKGIALALRVYLDLQTDDEVNFLNDAIGLFIQLGNRCDFNTAGLSVTEDPRTYPVMLILKPHGDYYKRVGITSWTHEAYLVENGRPHSDQYRRAGMGNNPDDMNLGVGTFKSIIMPTNSPLKDYLHYKETLYIE